MWLLLVYQACLHVQQAVLSIADLVLQDVSGLEETWS